MSEACRTCPLNSTNMSLATLCGDPSDTCRFFRGFESTFGDAARFQRIIEASGAGTLDLALLQAGDIVRLLGTSTDRGYGQPGGRALELSVGALDPDDGTLHTTVLSDGFSSLPPSHPLHKMLLAPGRDVVLVGNWDLGATEPEPVIGTLVLGRLAVYETDDPHPRRGMPLQEVTIGNSVVEQQEVWGTDPLHFQLPPDLLNQSNKVVN